MPIKAIRYKGEKERVGDKVTVYRSLPNPKIQAIGSIVFLDHVPSTYMERKAVEFPTGRFAHPHRGIATFSYILEGAIHHIDSHGGEGIVHSGGLQWMKAGNGIIHDEFMPFEFQKTGGNMQGLQFWLNLPSKNKEESPDYIAVKADDVPEVELANNAGVARVLIGEYDTRKSDIPTYLGQNMYHIKLDAHKSIRFSTIANWEYGVYAISEGVHIENDISLQEKELAKLEDFGKTIEIQNKSDQQMEFIFIGGEVYPETMVSYGPFIMNSKRDIQIAYDDYQRGKYGKIDYSKVKS